MKKLKIITIDGPASSGKTTVAKMLSKELNLPLLESGILYRLVTYLLLKSGDSFQDYLKDKKVLIEFLSKTFKKIKIKLSPFGTQVYFEGKMIKDELRSKEVEEVVSQVSAVKEVREFLTQFMRKLAKEESLVTEGRDMGSFVFPYADIKIFLTADEKIRAERRFREKIKEGEILYEEILNNIKFRDKLDAERKIAPLIIPNDAYVIDTSYLNPDEVLGEILKIIDNKK